MLLLRSIPATILAFSAFALASGCQSTLRFLEVEPGRSERRVPEEDRAAAGESATEPAPAPTAAITDVSLQAGAPEPIEVAAPAVAASDQPTTSTVAHAAPGAAPAASEQLPAAEPPINLLAAKHALPAVEESSTATTNEAPKATAAPSASAENALHTIYFDSDSSVLSLRNRSLLQENAAWLIAHPDFAAVIEGHTDATASEEYNVALGQHRAELVATYMMSLGVPHDRLSTISYGESRPVDPALTRAARAKNRRVQFLVYRKEAAAPTP